MKKHKVKLHLDGARAWNAAVALDLSLKEFCADFDLANFCLSKGIGCPVGTMLVGSHEDIAKAKIYRKMLGGAMR